MGHPCDNAGPVSDEPKETEGGLTADPSQPPPAPEADEAEESPVSEGGKPALTQDALARRVAALGGEDETERLAALEEEKLRERRARMKGKKGGGGLEEAASRRLARIGADPSPRPRKTAQAVQAVPAAPEGDPLLDRLAEVGRWAKKNSSTVATAVGIALLAGLAFVGYGYFQKHRETAASEALSSAVADARGRIGTEKEDENKFKDPTPIFKTEDERRDAALAKYREVLSKYAGTGAAMLARLGEGSLLLDKHDLDGALAAFADVRTSPLGQADVEVRGRALEGMGFVHELKAAALQGDEATKEQDAAIQAFKELEATDVKGFKELGLYHQGRVYQTKGDRPRAIEILKSVYERLAKPGENHPFPYLEEMTADRLRALDPSALPPKPTGQMGAGPNGGRTLTQEQIKKLMEQMQKQQGAGGGAPAHP